MFTKSLLAFVALCSSAFATTYVSDGTSADIQSKHDAAVSGDTITVPSGTFTWTGGLTLTKGVHIQGAGSGRVVARSRSPVAFGTGSKTFTITGIPSDELITALPIGATLRIWQLTTDKDASYMLGTITSLSGTTLTLDVTESTGSGTKTLWLFGTEHATKVVHSAGAATLIDITEDAAASVEVSGIQFTTGTGTGRLMEWDYASGGKPILVHDCWWNQSIDSVDIVHNNSTNRGVIWNCSITWTFDAQSNSVFFHSNPNARTESWGTASTMGSADTDGTHNIYIEACDVHGNQSAATDFDSNTRLVWRYNINDHAALNSHGNDTSTFGVRHVEYYNNRFEFANVGNDSINTVWHILLRGGTCVIADNFFEDITSQAWGSKAEINFGIWCLGRWHPGNIAYSADDGGVVEYPAPRQFGFGSDGGTDGVDGQGFTTRDGVNVGKSEPAYLWNNTGDAPAIAITTDGTPGVVNIYGNTPDDPADYIQAGRDYFNDGTAKPGYVKFTYPHPLRTESSPTTGTTTISGSGSTSVSGSGSTTIAQ